MSKKCRQMMKFKIIASGHNFSEYSCSTLHRLKSGDKREGAFLHHENQFLFCEIPPLPSNFQGKFQCGYFVHTQLLLYNTPCTIDGQEDVSTNSSYGQSLNKVACQELNQNLRNRSGPIVGLASVQGHLRMSDLRLLRFFDQRWRQRWNFWEWNDLPKTKL